MDAQKVTSIRYLKQLCNQTKVRHAACIPATYLPPKAFGVGHVMRVTSLLGYLTVMAWGENCTGAGKPSG